MWCQSQAQFHRLHQGLYVIQDLVSGQFIGFVLRLRLEEKVTLREGEGYGLKVRGLEIQDSLVKAIQLGLVGQFHLIGQFVSASWLFDEWDSDWLVAWALYSGSESRVEFSNQGYVGYDMCGQHEGGQGEGENEGQGQVYT